MPYVGGKQTMADQIVSLMAPHDHYLGSTRGRNTLYAREMPTADEHARLLEALLACRGQVILSGYASPLYDDALTAWERIEVGARDQASRDRVEVLWINRLPHPTLLESA